MAEADKDQMLGGKDEHQHLYDMLEEERVKLERHLDIVSAQTTMQGLFVDTRAVVSEQNKTDPVVREIDGVYNGKPATARIVDCTTDNKDERYNGGKIKHNVRIVVNDKGTGDVQCDVSVTKVHGKDYWKAEIARPTHGGTYTGGNPGLSVFPASDIFEGSNEMKILDERKVLPNDPIKDGLLPEVHSVAAMMKGLAATVAKPTVLVGTSA